MANFQLKGEKKKTSGIIKKAMLKINKLTITEKSFILLKCIKRRENENKRAKNRSTR